MTQLLIFGSTILGLNPIDVGDAFDLGDLLVAKDSVPGYSIISVELPPDYAPGKYEWANGLVPVPPSYTPEQLAEIHSRLGKALQGHIDAQAKALDYVSQDRLASYFGSQHARHGPEARAYVAWRDDVFNAAFAIERAVLAGERLPPSELELIAELPVYVQPEGLPPLPEAL